VKRGLYIDLLRSKRDLLVLTYRERKRRMSIRRRRRERESERERSFIDHQEEDQEEVFLEVLGPRQARQQGFMHVLWYYRGTHVSECMKGSEFMKVCLGSYPTGVSVMMVPRKEIKVFMSMWKSMERFKVGMRDTFSPPVLMCG
jgi:hypothetical protein